MRITRRCGTRSQVAIFGALAASCIESAPSSVDQPVDASLSPSPAALLPWRVGSSWTYRVTDHAVVSQKVTTIEPLEPIGGSGPHQAELAFKVVTLKADSGARSGVVKAPWREFAAREVSCQWRSISTSPMRSACSRTSACSQWPWQARRLRGEVLKNQCWHGQSVREPNET